MAQVDTYVKILKPYKFYLSFENSLCMNYITEKFFYTFASNEGPLPIALGGYQTSEYSRYDKILVSIRLHFILTKLFLWRFAPPHSYLHVSDFHSVKDLASELEKLSLNEEAYNEYFW